MDNGTSVPAYDRSKLGERQTPHMTLAKGSPINHAARSDPRHASPPDTAQGRFSVVGNAVVTGGTGGIGAAVCRALLQHGLRGLMILDLDLSVPVLDDLRKEFPEAKILARSVDVTHEADVRGAIAEAAEQLGSIDVLVCLAGMVGAEDALGMTIARFRRMMDVNTTGTFIAAQAAAQHMVRQGTGGSIVLTASISGHSVNFPQPQVSYNASKAALLSMTKSLAAEWARYGIRVNSVSPGYTNTVLNRMEGTSEIQDIWFQRNPQGRMGEPEELAGVVVLMCSRAGTYMTGADVVVDGGGRVF